MGRTSRKNCSVVIRYGRSCSKISGKVSRIGEKKKKQSNCTKFQALVWTIIKSKKKSLNQLENDRVRGLWIATGQYSSFCGCAEDLVLGGFDHVEVEVQDREQAEVREK